MKPIQIKTLKGARQMLEVRVSPKVTRPEHQAEHQVFTGIVKLYGFDKLTPRAARAALEVAGYTTGTAWGIEPPMKAIPYCEAEGCSNEPCTPAQWRTACRKMGWDNGELTEHPDIDDNGRDISYWTDQDGDVILRSRWEANAAAPVGYRIYAKTARKLYANDL
jgi:hypothetical protein